MKLSGVMIGTENPNGLAAFYEKAFGPAGWSEGEWHGYQVGTGILMIGPHSEVHSKSAEPARIMISVESTDVQQDFEYFVASGATVVAEPYNPDAQKPDIWLATVADPDGNYLQLASPW